MRDSIKFCLFLLRLLRLYYILTKYIYIQFSYFVKNDCFLFIPIKYMKCNKREKFLFY